MIVRMWMTRDVVTAAPGTPITEASELMSLSRIRRLPVVEDQHGVKRLLGIVTASDILHAFPPEVNPFAVLRDRRPGEGAAKVSDIMHSNLLTARPDAPLEEAAEVMRSRKVGALPVLENDTLAGLITESDIFRAFTGLFASKPGSVRITFDVSEGEDAFALLAQLVQRHHVRVNNLVSSQLDGRPVCVAQVAGRGVDAMLEDLWKSHHSVLNVLRR